MEQLARFNLLAAYHDLAEAEVMLEDLHASGIPHEELSLLTREEAHKLSPDDSPPQDLQDTAKKAVAGAAAGGAVGGTLGAIAGIASIGLPGVGVAIGAGAIFAAAAGGVLGAQSTADPEAWKERLDPVLGLVGDGYVLVGVHTGDAGRAASAEELLRNSDPYRLERIDTSEGSFDGG
jgi:hypothetical protein